MFKRPIKSKKKNKQFGRRNNSFSKRLSKNWFKDKSLPPPDWSRIKLEEVKKDCYQEHQNVKARDEIKVKEYMEQNRISVQGRDCPKPVEAFDEFHFSDGIMDAIKALNFVKPTPIQSQAIPVALSGRDMVGIADTGSGKTLAFILPAITHILENNYPRNVGEPAVVVLAPTRELAQQIHQVVVSLGPGINVKSECFFGGTKRVEQAVLTEKVFEICIATPGRMVDFLGEGYVKLHKCTFFVLDEADRMLDMGFEPQINMVIGQSRPDRQMLMFSATWPPEIRDLAEKYLNDYIRVNIGSLEISANHNITQKIELCDVAGKTNRIVKVMKQVMQEEENKTLIFVNSKIDVDVLTLQFRLNGWAAMGLHGGKKQIERDQVFNDFKHGKILILIATDLAARGLDVDDIKYIINYDYPTSSEDYVHRIGRTGRCDRKGTAITFFTQRDRDKARDLIKVLEEAGQYVPPQMYNMSQLPALSKQEKRMKPPGSKIKKKQLKRLVQRSDINNVPLGSETNSNSLPNLDEVIDANMLEAVSVPGKKKKNKRKFALMVNSEKKLEIVQSQPNPSKRAKTNIPGGNLHTDATYKYRGDHYSDDFSNPQWGPSASHEKYEERARNMQANFKNPQWGPSASLQKYEENAKNIQANFKNSQWGPSASFQKYEESSRNIPTNKFGNDAVSGRMNRENPDVEMMDGGVGRNHGIPFSNTHVSADVRRANNFGNNTNPPLTGSTSMNNPSLGMKDKDMGHNREIPFNNNPISADVRRRDNVYSIDNRNKSLSMNSKNYETSMDPRSMGHSMNTGNMKMPMGPIDTGMPRDPRSTQPSYGVRNQSSSSFDQRQNSRGWNDAPAWGRNSTGNNYNNNNNYRTSPSGNNYRTEQASNWEPQRSNYSMNRTDMNPYRGQNWSGRSGYSQY